jgi:hypothetical protein
MDGTLNQSGEVTKGVILIIKHNGKPQKHLFYVANIGEDNIILGYPFLEHQQILGQLHRSIMFYSSTM